MKSGTEQGGPGLLASMLVNIGDVIMMTAALDLIKQTRPRTRLAVLARPEAAELLRGNPCLDELIVYPYRSGAPFQGLGGLLKLMRSGRYETFLSLDRRPRGAMAAALAGIKDRVGPDRLFAGSKPEFWNRLLFTRRIHILEEECRASQVEMFQLTARRAFNTEARGRITLPPLSPEKKEWAARLLAGAGGPVIGFCVKTNDARKTWPMNRFVILMTRLYRDFGAFMYVTGGPADREYAGRLTEALGPVPALNLAGQTTLTDIRALAAQSDLFISPDNGTGHLAANSGLKKLICLLVSTTPEFIIDSMPQAQFVSFSPPPPGGDWPAQAAEAEADRVFQAARRMIEKK